MLYNEESINALRSAVEISPDNLPLREHLADVLYQTSNYIEAIDHLLYLARKRPDDPEIRLRLANVYFITDKISQAIVITEQLAEQGHNTPQLDLLRARLMRNEGEEQRSVDYYRRAIEADPSLVDPTLEEELDFDMEEPYEDPFIDEEGRIRMLNDDPACDFADMELEKPAINFTDVGGMSEIKEEIRLKIVHPLQHPELYEAYGKSAGGGILLYGPPGCGKTYLARATSGEIQSSFFSLGLNHVLDMYIGQSEQKLHAIFQHARQNAPCVLFIDEVDALGAKRSDMRNSHGRHLINQFLAELDGSQHSNEGLLIMAATNAPWFLDPAFRRPGRFDRMIFVPPPDLEARKVILQLEMANKPQEKIDWTSVAKKTAGFSGADIKSMVDMAIEGKLQQAIKTNRPSAITGKDLIAAGKKIKPVSREWFSGARNYAMYANDAGMYDDVLEYEKRNR